MIMDERARILQELAAVEADIAALGLTLEREIDRAKWQQRRQVLQRREGTRPGLIYKVKENALLRRR
jgi:hypothetical protein